MKRFFLTSLLTILFTGFTSLFAQGTGAVSGKVLDSETGESMLGVTVIFSELQLFAVTDLDGNYYIGNVPAGKHLMRFQIAGYKTSQTNVEVAAGATKRVNITMGYQTLDEVVVTAKRVDNTTAALLTKMKKAPVAQDAISSEQISKSPDSDAGDAAKRVTGVSIIGSKYVYIRGLSERYSTILVNNAVVPSPQPNKRIVPLDVFPVALLDNLTVSKTFAPDMPNDVSGGVVFINTKAYPSEPEAKVSIGTGYNSQTTGKSFKTFDGGAYNYLGYNDGIYDIPTEIPTDAFPDSSLGSLFTTRLGSDSVKALPAGSISASFGNTYRIAETKELGIMLGASYKEKSQTIDDGEFYRYESGLSPVKETDYRYDEYTFSTENNVQLQAGLKPDRKNSLKLTTFYTHGADKTVRINTGIQTSQNKIRETLKFEETSLFFSQLTGEHRFPNIFDSTLEWDGSYSIANKSTPDTRITEYQGDGQILSSQPINRYYTEYSEQAMQSIPSITLPFKQWNGLVSKFKTGGGVSFRQRQNSARRFNFDFVTTPLSDPYAPVDDLVEEVGLTVTDTTGTVLPFFDAYEGTLLINTGYGMIDMPLVKSWRLITGVRAELWEQKVRSYSPLNEDVFTTSTLDGTDIFPSINLVWAINNQTNVRIGGSRTINRPDFLEASNFRYYDEFETGGLIYGNPDLISATTQNYDIRFEWFPSSAEVIAVSAFYKAIDNPIESTVEKTGGNYRFTYNNQDQAELFGSEIEARKNLEFISSSIKDFSILTNLTFVYSRIKYNPNIATSETDTERPLQGQSPWIFNAGLFYDNDPFGLNVSLLYNIFGPRIRQVGVNNVPSIYEEPYGKLDFVLAKTMGKHMKVKGTVSNILNPYIEQYVGDGDDRLLAARYRTGVSAGIGLDYKF